MLSQFAFFPGVPQPPRRAAILLLRRGGAHGRPPGAKTRGASAVFHPFGGRAAPSAPRFLPLRRSAAIKSRAASARPGPRGALMGVNTNDNHFRKFALNGIPQPEDVANDGLHFLENFLSGFFPLIQKSFKADFLSGIALYRLTVTGNPLRAHNRVKVCT